MSTFHVSRQAPSIRSHPEHGAFEGPNRVESWNLTISQCFSITRSIVALDMLACDLARFETDAIKVKQSIGFGPSGRNGAAAAWQRIDRLYSVLGFAHSIFASLVSKSTQTDACSNSRVNCHPSEGVR